MLGAEIFDIRSRENRHSQDLFEIEKKSVIDSVCAVTHFGSFRILFCKLGLFLLAAKENLWWLGSSMRKTYKSASTFSKAPNFLLTIFFDERK